MELIRKIRTLLYLEGFTISGARQKLESDTEGTEIQQQPATAASKPKVSKEVIGGLINELEELTVMLRD